MTGSDRVATARTIAGFPRHSGRQVSGVEPDLLRGWRLGTPDGEAFVLMTRGVAEGEDPSYSIDIDRWREPGRTVGLIRRNTRRVTQQAILLMARRRLQGMKARRGPLRG